MKIVGWGDSTTAGTPGFRSPVEAPPNGDGNEESQYSYWMMKEHPEWEVLNRGINGERTDQILRRFSRDVGPERPKIVVVLGGVNDVYQGYPVEFTQKNLAAMYSMVKDMEAMPIGCSVLPYDTMTPRQATARMEINRWVETECGKRSIVFCDTAAAVSSTDDPDKLSGTPDGLHPDIEGYRSMSKALSKSVEKSLA